MQNMTEQHKSVVKNVVRDNATWLEQLSEGSMDQQVALSDLRVSLLRGLSGAMVSRTYVNESFLEDAVQDALILILKKINQFEGRSQFTTWATSIAIRVAMSKLRRKQWQDVSLESELMDDNFKFEKEVDIHSEQEASCVKDSILKEMYAVIKNDLTDKQRIALLSELKGIPQDEIARQLGSNRNAVYKLTHDARKRLKNSLETAGFEIADIYTAFTT
jgi:RNA polymerase sigma factor (sigma-70 family)